MRVATKYVNLTRRFFAEHGVADYRIVESLGATEGAPAAGAAELIVDITTTGATLAANALKTLDDGVILRSQANLVASLKAPWSPARARRRARDPDAHRRDRGGAPLARSSRPPADARPISWSRRPARTFDAVPAFGEDADPQGFVTLHCARGKAADLADWLLAQGAERVTVAAVEQVFDKRNPLWDALVARIRAGVSNFFESAEVFTPTLPSPASGGGEIGKGGGCSAQRESRTVGMPPPSLAGEGRVGVTLRPQWPILLSAAKP